MTRAPRMRLCRAEDLPALEWGGLFTHHREIIRGAFERQCRGDNLMLLAVANDFPVGQVWMDLARLRHESAALLWALRVFPGFQGAGIGSRLVREAERRLRRLGVRSAEIGAERDNPGARRLYERLGYAVVRAGRETYAYTTPAGVTERVTVDQWLMRKRLADGAEGGC